MTRSYTNSGTITASKGMGGTSVSGGNGGNGADGKVEVVLI